MNGSQIRATACAQKKIIAPAFAGRIAPQFFFRATFFSCERR
jgi:hypothetical protein